jgi:hypothetical protein
MRVPTIILAAGALLGEAALAEPPPLRRGLNFDIWIEWLSVGDMLADPAFLTPYPDRRRVVTAAQVDLVAAQGFDFVRLPMDPAPLLALGPGARQDALIADIRAGAEIALGAGLDAVVDLHSIPRPDEHWGTDAVVGPLWNDYLALVERVAAALDGLPPDRVAFEPLNEPTLDCESVWGDAAPRWPAMLLDLHAAARAGAPMLPIVLSGACWGGVEGLEQIDPAVFADPDLIWSFHSYDPFTFTHQGANWVEGAERYLAGLAYPPSTLAPADAGRIVAGAEARAREAGDAAAADRIAGIVSDYLAQADTAAGDEIQRAAAWADRHGVPRARLILGEFGALRRAHGLEAPPPSQHRFLSDKRGAAEAAGIGWAVWTWVGDMGVAVDGDPDRRLGGETCAALGLAPCSP